MRFLHLNHRYHPFTGGSELFIKELSERLVSTGHSVRVVTSTASDLDYFWDQRKRRVAAPSREQINGVDVRRVEVGRFPGQRVATFAGRRSMGELSRIARTGFVLEQFAAFFPRMPQFEASLFEAGVPDCILATNLGFEGMALTALSTARKYGVPFVMLPFAHLGAADDETARRYVSMPHQRKLLRSADLVLTLTELEAGFMGALGVDDSRIRVISSGANEADVTGGCGQAFRQRLGCRGMLVGALGALAPEKGTPELMRAVANLRQRGAKIELALAGPMMASFESWWREVPVVMRDGIHVLGMVDDEGKRDFLDAIDMLALPSRTESFGIVYLEAWLNRKPVIAARAGAVPEVVQDGENGILVTYGDIDGIEAAITRLSDDPALRQRLANAGRERAQANYTWDKVFRRFQDAYADVLGIEVGRADQGAGRG